MLAEEQRQAWSRGRLRAARFDAVCSIAGRDGDAKSFPLEDAVVVPS
jgi:hypothetical protein